MSDTEVKREKRQVGFAIHPENINRKGREKKGETYTDIIRLMGDEIVGDDKLSRKQQLVTKLWNKALIDNDFAAQKYLFDRVDGQPTVRNVIETDVIESIVEAVDKIDE
jgi:hypothetical protein